MWTVWLQQPIHNALPVTPGPEHTDSHTCKTNEKNNKTKDLCRLHTATSCKPAIPAAAAAAAAAPRAAAVVSRVAVQAHDRP